MPLRLHHHRRYTANHTWYLDLAGRALFVKVNPSRGEALRETRGHQRIRGHYRVPELHLHGPLGRRYLHVYHRQNGVGTDRGLLVDLLTAADHDRPGGHAWPEMQEATDALISHYRRVISATAAHVPGPAVEGKLFADRAAPGGRLDTYYRTDPDRAWLTAPTGATLRIRDLPASTLVINGRAHRVGLPSLLDQLRDHLASDQRQWAALTQGDPTGFNLGWTRQTGPFWFDYDTAGLNALAGEFAVFLVDVLLHGARLTPSTNPAAYRDHPAALGGHIPGDGVRLHRLESGLVDADVHHQPSPARLWLATAYLRDLVGPTAAELGITDAVGWLRPYLLLRLLGVYHPADLHWSDALVLLATITRVLHAQPGDALTELFTLGAPETDP